jgi:hypothetical protein
LKIKRGDRLLLSSLFAVNKKHKVCQIAAV